jgi:hypothetical protein
MFQLLLLLYYQQQSRVAERIGLASSSIAISLFSSSMV